MRKKLGWEGRGDGMEGNKPQGKIQHAASSSVSKIVSSKPSVLAPAGARLATGAAGAAWRAALNATTDTREQRDIETDAWDNIHHGRLQVVWLAPAASASLRPWPLGPLALRAGNRRCVTTTTCNDDDAWDHMKHMHARTFSCSRPPAAPPARAGARLGALPRPLPPPFIGGGSKSNSDEASLGLT